MSDLKQVAGQAAKKYGLNPTIFKRQIQQESGFQTGRVSPAGARGVAQIMPATAQGWGVNPDDPYAALDAAAKHMAQYVKQYGSYKNALVAYNAGPGRVGKALPAETRDYISKILGKGGASSNTAETAYGPAARTRYLPATTKTDESGAAIDALLAHARGPGSSLLQNFVRNLDSGLYTNTTPGKTVTVPGQAPASGAASSPLARGKVSFAPTANRKGVALQAPVLSFVQHLSGIAGPLKVGTGTNHNQFVAGTHRESDHWTGNAVDIPAAGARLTKLGQDALIAAGMNPAKARKIKGGLFNVSSGGHRVQVIFNSNEGGNHFNHLHVGVR